MTRFLASLTVAAVLVGLGGCARPGTVDWAGDGVSVSVAPFPSPSPSSPPSPSLAPGPSSAPTFAPPPTVPAGGCAADGVRVEIGEVDAASGLRAVGVTLVNCGTKPYRVNGYPALRVLDEQGVAVKVRVLDGVTEITGSIPNWTGPPTAVVLAPGQQAGAVVAWRNTYDDISEPPVNATYLAVAPAVGKPARLLTPGGNIDLGSTGRIGVSPWRLS